MGLLHRLQYIMDREARKRFQARSERIAEQRELNEKGRPYLVML